VIRFKASLTFNVVTVTTQTHATTLIYKFPTNFAESESFKDLAADAVQTVRKPVFENTTALNMKVSLIVVFWLPFAFSMAQAKKSLDTRLNGAHLHLPAALVSC
jgi:hypothetical protein